MGSIAQKSKGLARYVEPGIIRSVGLPGGEARVMSMDLHRQLIDTTPRGPYGVPLQSWAEHAVAEGMEYGWAEVVRDDGIRERWLIDFGDWYRKLEADEPDPVIEAREIIGGSW